MVPTEETSGSQNIIVIGIIFFIIVIIVSVFIYYFDSIKSFMTNKASSKKNASKGKGNLGDNDDSDNSSSVTVGNNFNQVDNILSGLASTPGPTKSTKYVCPASNLPVNGNCKAGYTAELIRGVDQACCFPPLSKNGSPGILDLLKDQIAPLALSIVGTFALEYAKVAIKASYYGTAALKKELKHLKMVARELEEGGTKSIQRYSQKLMKKNQEKFGKKFVEEFGQEIAEREALEMSQKLNKQIAAKTTKMTAVAATGPVGWAVNLFEIFNLLIDIWDPGGYGNLRSQDQMKQNRDMIIESFEAAIQKSGVQTPIVVNLLNSIPTSALNNIMGIFINQYSSLYIVQAMGQVGSLQALSPTDMSNYINLLTTNITKYLSSDAGSIMLQEASCVYFNGTFDKTISRCIYTSEDTCEASFQWPLRTNPANPKNYIDTYAEWRDGHCIMQAPQLRTTCENYDLGVTYNKKTQSCNITEIYCARYGVDFESNDEGNDCNLALLQEASEFMLSTTTVRGLRQIFDPSQYKPCKSGQTDLAYFCKDNCKSGYTDFGVVCWISRFMYTRSPDLPTLSSCEGSQIDLGLACMDSPSCDWSGCSGGTTDLKSLSCGNRQEMSLLFCYDKCESNYYGIGPVCTYDSFPSYVPGIYPKDRLVPLGTNPDLSPSDILGKPRELLKGLTGSLTGALGINIPTRYLPLFDDNATPINDDLSFK